MSEYIVNIKDLYFEYTNKKQILNIESFQLSNCENVFLYGPSGCGKSTFLAVIAGVLKATQGSIKVFEHEFTKSSSATRDKIRGERMGYIFQMFNLIPYLTVFENITLPCKLSKSRMSQFANKKDFFDKSMALCQKFKIDSIINQKVTDISIGQQQRVAAARALIGNPKLIIADEPTSAMDADLQEIFLECLFSQCEEHKAALLFVSHDKRLAKIFTRRIFLPEINRAVI